MSLRVELTFSNGMKQTFQAEQVLFVLRCKFEDCGQEFRDEYRTAEYCSDECQGKAKYRREKLKPCQ